MAAIALKCARAGDLILVSPVSPVSSTRFIGLDAAVRSTNTVRAMARDTSGATFDVAAANLSVEGSKRQVQ